jgi:hypothetical protein
MFGKRRSAALNRQRKLHSADCLAGANRPPVSGIIANEAQDSAFDAPASPFF